MARAQKRSLVLAAAGANRYHSTGAAARYRAVTQAQHSHRGQIASVEPPMQRIGWCCYCSLTSANVAPDKTWDTESTLFKSKALRHLNASGSFDRPISNVWQGYAGSLRG
ncbi:hypothetical protein TrVFT333_000992 [Trichoderma virens FT-333]|nr:hypothetical protein TrVFT333_000992 [Trichoderma virens FT-333]